MFTIWIQNDFLNVPVKNGGEKIKVVLRDRADNRLLRFFYLEFGTGEKDFTAFYNIADLKGREVSFEIIKGPVEESALQSALQFSDQPLGMENLYQEELRPQIHFTSRRGWLNDPNGLVFYEGRYHLFYQHNPFGLGWGSMHWGHAVSDNLFDWQEEEIALFPDELGTMYSGSGLVDWSNTSGLGSEGRPPLCFFYTAAGEHALEKCPYTQCLAYSNDGARTLTKYSGNPIVSHIAGGNRDPKVIRYRKSGDGKWIMVLYLEKQHDDQIYAILSSENLIDWQELQRISLPGSGECPDFFPLTVDGTEKWVFWGADGYYLTGEFDGNIFTPDGQAVKAYAGGAENRGNNYAGQTWSDLKDNRRLHIAWLQGNLPDMPFNQQMSIPVEMSLKSTEKGPQLAFKPAEELFGLISHTEEKTDIVSPDKPITIPLNNKAAVIDLIADKTAGITTGSGNFKLDAKLAKISWPGGEIPFDIHGDKLELQLVLDACSVEIFGNDGLFYLALSIPGILKEDLQLSSAGKIGFLRISHLR